MMNKFFINLVSLSYVTIYVWHLDFYVLYIYIYVCTFLFLTFDYKNDLRTNEFQKKFSSE